MMQCHDRLIHAGINLNLFATSASTADVHDLIQALGYQQVNLYGGSYGSRWALEGMRDFPRQIRSVILDSTLPLQVDLFTSVPASAMRAFKALFTACAANTTCQSVYPHLEATFYRLVDTLNAQPLTLRRVVDPYTNKDYTVALTGWRLVNLLFLALY